MPAAESAARPIFSVALCTHNGGRFLATQLASILSQSTAPAELIVSDDDSSDGTVAVARGGIEGANARPVVRWIENRPALGVTKNFEGAITATTGELIALSDQDDVWHPDKLARAAAVFAADAAALLLFTDARLVDGDGAPLDLGLFESLGVTESELRTIASSDPLAALLRRNLATGATVVFRRELLETALPFPDSWVHDEWLAVMAALRGGLRVLREQTVDYRQHGRNEIGVNEPTLRYRVGRMLQPRGDRNEKLARKFADLADWAQASGQQAELVARLRAKADFERARAGLPGIRLARIPRVVELALRGLYARYASQGWLDVMRDLVQQA
ncbi:glycosyltransferase family 2 protein [Gryllotalpicola protaetiae]|uniref:Glycosyltransferase family 2 protein n=1 Tax=Gryllotalpicola protaetiae TaxID=2419771 RepID=A0A387BQE0_9MICO|nr:glycosyltransferase family 2 protein [Gryllotalpicola protaetiae]AYG04284.1 glycosyltransferase family 2 protein [Gryllotalpicola protaetiae]